MADREANVRVNVRGNAAPELAKIEKSGEQLGKKLGDAGTKAKVFGDALDKAANKSKGAGEALKKTTDEATKNANAWSKSESASIKAAVAYQANANAAKAVEGANRRATSATDSFARATDRANASTRNLAANTRNIDINRWQQLAGIMGRIGRMNVGFGSGGSFGRMAAGVGSLIGTGIDTARGFGSTLGIPGRDQLAQEFATFDVTFARLSNQAGLDAGGKAQLRNQINTAARAGAQDPSQVLEALNVAQNRFSNLEFFAQNATRFAETAQALGTPMGDIVGAVGEFQRQLGVTAQEVPELIGMMAEASRSGSIEFSDISQEFATTIGNFARVTGAQGMEGARQFIAVAQVLGTGGAGGAGSAVLAQNLLAKFSSADVQRNLRRAGVRTRDREGNFVGFQTVVDQIAGNRRFVGANGQVNSAALQGIIGRDMQANTALGIMISETLKARAEGREAPISALAASSAASGNQVIDRTLGDIRASAGGGAMAAATNARTNFLENGEGLVRNMTRIAGATSDLETRFPQLSAATDVLRSSFGNLHQTVSQIAMIQLASGAAGATGGAAGAMGAGGKFGMAAAGLATAGVAVSATLAIQDALGMDASSNWRDFWSGNWSADSPTVDRRSNEQIRADARRNLNEQNARNQAEGFARTEEQVAREQGQVQLTGSVPQVALDAEFRRMLDRQQQILSQIARNTGATPTPDTGRSEPGQR